ncbi:MAG: Uma2 family endonuclease [Pyrinomonadaceae bacterium]
MSAVLDIPRTTSLNAVKKAIELVQQEEVAVSLANVSWEIYDQAVQIYWGKQSPRFYYQKGKLLIMPTSKKHEDLNRAIASFVEVCCLEWEVNWRNFGSATYQGGKSKGGFEPDSCFYFKNEAIVEGKEKLDLSSDSPPELIVEVDMTSSSTERESIFAEFGVAEIWRYENEQMQILILTGTKYKTTERSLALPLVTSEVLTNFVLQSRNLSRLEWLKSVRSWAKEVN